MIEIDGYTDIEPIGHGGLGDVFRATRASTGATVAVKVLRDVSDASVAWHRTSRELTAMVALAGHAHVVQLLELLDLPEGPALVMEYAPGGSVADLIRQRDDTLSVPEAVLVGRHTAAALVAAHARGIVHRDIKPQNLLIDAYGQVKLCDFGIAALTRSEEYRNRTDALSLRYASPEDLDADTGAGDDDVGPASDVYSLGATLLHVARGAPPTLKERLAPWPPPPTDDPEQAALDTVIAACLHPDPSERPTAAEVLDDLERLGWAIEERHRALAFDPPLVDDLAAADEPTDRRPAGVAIADDEHGVSSTDTSARGAWVADQRGPAGDRTARRTPGGGVVIPRPTERRGRSRRTVRWSIAAAVVGAIAVGGVVLIRPSDVAAPTQSATSVDDAPNPAAAAPTVVPATSTAVTAPPSSATPTAPTPAAATTAVNSTVVAVVSIVDRPSSLVDVDDASIVWPYGAEGECLVQTAGATELEPIDCSEPHDLQRFAVGELTGPLAAGAYDADAVDAAVAAECDDRFEAFVGAPYDESELDAPFTAPSSASWAGGDRAFQCFVGVHGRRVVGDAAGWAVVGGVRPGCGAGCGGHRPGTIACGRTPVAAGSAPRPRGGFTGACPLRALRHGTRSIRWEGRAVPDSAGSCDRARTAGASRSEQWRATCRRRCPSPTAPGSSTTISSPAR